MQLEITPEPSAAERSAIERALGRVLTDGERRSAWHEAGVLESTEGSRRHAETFDADTISPLESSRRATSE